ncbi:MAG: hypothetical protein VYD53_04500, partial [Pseudomonadota bacterium]|nr:hypothetical protein [Pseudomonadota bacterium]
KVTDASVAALKETLTVCEITHGEQPPSPPPGPAPEKESLVWVSDPDNPQNVLVEQNIRNKINKSTGELSGADLEKVHRETVLQALSKNTDKICQSTLVEEINILKYGAKRTLDKCAYSGRI